MCADIHPACRSRRARRRASRGSWPARPSDRRPPTPPSDRRATRCARTIRERSGTPERSGTRPSRTSPRGAPAPCRGSDTRSARHDLFAGALCVDDSRYACCILRRQPVDNRTVTLTSGQPQHALPQRRDENRHRLLGHQTQLEPFHRERLIVRGRPSRRRARTAEKRNVSRTRLYGSTNGMPFHPSTMTFDDAPMPATKRPGAAAAKLAIDWASSPRASRVHGQDRGAEAGGRGPHRCERKRREGVGRVRLRRPQIGVPVGQSSSNNSR